MPQGENNKSVRLEQEDHNAATQKAGKNYLLVIGIDEYVHCPTLYNAVKDAKDIVEVLISRFQFETENIQTLYNQAATKSNIYKAFEYFAEKVTPADNFLLYFSGHGEFKKLFNLGYWIPVEAEIDATHKFIPNSEVKNILSAIKSHHTFLMADSCFSGSLFAKGTGKNISLRKEKDPSRWGLTAGRNEIVTDGTPGKNSPFAESILYQLRNADSPIGVAELCNKVLEVVAANADQTPRGEPLKIEGHRGGQFVFHLKMDEVADWNNALSTNTVAAFKSFVAKYPDSKNTLVAKDKIKALQAENLWQKIEQTRATTLNEVKNKLRLVNQYVDKHENQVHYDEALNVGELLDYKKQFLQAQSSEFALRRFLRKPIPNVEGASAIKDAARGKLADWNDTPTEVEAPAKIIPPIKKKVEEKPKIKPTPKPNIPSSPTPSFFEKYRKYLVLLLIPLIGYGIFQATNIGGSDITPIKESTVLDKTPTKEPDDPKVAALAKARQKYQTLLAKGDAELQNKTPNYQTAKGYYQDAINAAKDFAIDTKAAETGSKKCTDEIAKQSAAEREKQRKAKAAKIQKDYDQLISEGNRYYDKDDYKNALAKYQAAKGKIKNDYAARRGITKSQDKLDEIEKNRQAQLAADQAKKAHDKAWTSAKSRNTIAAYEAYQKKYPNGKYYNDATSQIKKLKAAATANANSGTFKDARDGQTYKWVRLKDGKKWMAQNLNYKTPDSWWYERKSSNGKKYGRLYTWQAAKNACPSGWRLPSDDEWWKMASYYGKAYNSQSGQQINKNKEGDAGEAAYKALMQGGNSGFSALLGGQPLLRW